MKAINFILPIFFMIAMNCLIDPFISKQQAANEDSFIAHKKANESYSTCKQMSNTSGTCTSSGHSKVSSTLILAILQILPLGSLGFGVGIVLSFTCLAAFAFEYNPKLFPRLLVLIIFIAFITVALPDYDSSGNDSSESMNCCQQNLPLHNPSKQSLNQTEPAYAGTNCLAAFKEWTRTQLPGIISSIQYSVSLLYYVARIFWTFNPQTKHDSIGVLLYWLLFPAAFDISTGIAEYFGFEAFESDIISGYALGWIMTWILMPKIIHAVYQKQEKNFELPPNNTKDFSVKVCGSSALPPLISEALTAGKEK